MSRIGVATICLDAGTQPRAEIDSQVIQEYAEAMKAGAKFPPVVVFSNGGDERWLADGFHRVWAAQLAKLSLIEATIRKGSKREAVLYAVGSNAEHGLRRTNADKRRAVMILLRDEEWRGWSDREIARRCAVSHLLVGNLRRELAPPPSPASGNDCQIARTVRRKGTTYQQKTIRKVRESGVAARADAEHDEAQRAETERRKHFSMALIAVLRTYATTEITPERAVAEFFPYVAHAVDDHLRPGVAWLTAFERLWRNRS